MRKTLTCAILVFTSAIFFGCGGRDPADVCDEFAGDFARAVAKCGADPAQARELVLQAVGGSCLKVVGVRDEDSFYSDCLPWLENASCDVLAADSSAMPPSCKGQLEVK